MCVEPVCVWNVEHMHNVCGVWRVCVWMSECWSVDVCGECTVRAKFGVFVHAPVGQVLERVHAAPHVQCARAGAERAPAPPLRPGPVCGGCCRAGRRERAASEAAPLRNAERRGRVTGRGGPGVPGLKRAGSRWGGRGHVQDVLQEGNSTCQRCILGSQERKPGAAEAAVEQRPGGRGLQRQRTMHGTTLLMVAAYAGHIDCVRELVLQGADINLQREDGGTALLAASQYGHMQVVETLLKHGANIHDQLYDGATALFLAAQGGYLDVIRLLLASGAKVNQPRQDGTAPLWIASQMGHSEVVRVMLLRGAERDAARNDGTTALLKAANKGYNDVIEELLKFSPTLGILKNGTSALHAAVLSGNIKTVALLLEAGADPSLRNKANELPAELTKNERILRLLRSKEGPRKS
ncbi:ankyrin repeat domain-containing protein 29 isoform X3 [Chlorocebus sabaeus]|uniref:ankyrin repeat domain-containing protein 29 isoform X3 n=1 Tax=Chlorocebus sabaeus TaxID=60711 RepID=UPI00045DDD74